MQCVFDPFVFLKVQKEVTKNLKAMHLEEKKVIRKGQKSMVRVLNRKRRKDSLKEVSNDSNVFVWSFILFLNFRIFFIVCTMFKIITDSNYPGCKC